MPRRDNPIRPAPITQTLLCMIALICLLSVLDSPFAQAQTSTPLNLGEVIQKKTKGAPAPRTYLKLPQTVPVPTKKPAKAGLKTETTTPGETPDATAPNSETAAPNASNTATPPSAEQQPQAPQIQPGGIARLQLTALLSDQGEVLQRGINWRVFHEKADETGRLPLLHNVDGGPISFDLDPGSYVVYAGYGFANLTKRIVLEKAGDYAENFNLQAGAIRLNAVATGDVPLDASILHFNIYDRGTDEGGGQKLVVDNVKPQHVVKLTEGTYHIVSSYGTSNAKVRGDVEIKAGKLINVTMIHSAAKVTLRLVSEPGGEALANTVWTVLTPGGDVVKRAIGAFPTLALASGDYTAIAKQNEEIYNRDFSVDSGLDRDIEVLATTQ